MQLNTEMTCSQHLPGSPSVPSPPLWSSHCCLKVASPDPTTTPTTVTLHALLLSEMSSSSSQLIPMRPLPDPLSLLHQL